MAKIQWTKYNGPKYNGQNTMDKIQWTNSDPQNTTQKT